MFCRKNLKLMDSLKLRAYWHVWWKTESSFHVVVGQASSIRSSCIQSSGIELSGLTLEPLASSDAVLSQEESGCCSN
jgi:hypothetical protein